MNIPLLRGFGFFQKGGDPLPKKEKINTNIKFVWFNHFKPINLFTFLCGFSLLLVLLFLVPQNNPELWVLASGTILLSFLQEKQDTKYKEHDKELVKEFGPLPEGEGPGD